MTGARLALGLLLALASHALPARSQVMHRIERGDTLGLLAERYYGDASLADLIAGHNRIEGRLEPGIEIRLPSASRHEVARGESWSDLAARYWGDAALGRSLARWCGSEGDSEPGAGTVLTIPALVRHRLAPGETLIGLARRFYRDPDRAQDLGRLNRVDEPRRLHAGRELRIPLLASVRDAPVQAGSPASRDRSIASEPPPPGPSASEVASGPALQTELFPGLMAAVNAYLDGSFEDALIRLEAQRSRVLAAGSDNERGLLLRYLMYSYVAFERNDAACDAFAALREIADPPDLDPEIVSPKIREVLRHCE